MTEHALPASAPTSPSTATERREDQWSTNWWRPAGWILALAWLAAFVLVPAIGAKHSTYDRLITDLNDLTSVTVIGEPATGSGWTSVTVQWHSAGLTRRVDIIDATSPRRASEARRENQMSSLAGGPPLVVVGLEDDLRSFNDDLQIHWVPRHSGLTSEIAGFHAPGWLGLFLLGLGLTTLTLLMSGPRPRRANRWAWFWMMAMSPLGVGLYLLFAGPLGRRTPPVPRKPFMRGGWGFIAALALAGLWAWTPR